MKILFLDSPAFAKFDMIEAFGLCGAECDLFFHEAYLDRSNPEFDRAFDQAAEKAGYAFVFSFNYCPILAACCKRHGLKYVSYVYDSPLAALYSYTLISPYNTVFLFDKATYEKFADAGIGTVRYLPLAANVTRIRSLSAPEKLLERIRCDISFVGSLYNESHNLFERLSGLSDYASGYLDAIMLAQQKVYGTFFLEELLHPQILSELQKSMPYVPLHDGTEPASWVYANYFLARKITSRERLSLLAKISEQFPLKLFSHHPSPALPKAEFMGAVDYYDIMPLVFSNSRINLNITLKSIHTGIPLRCMDIMGAGAFLLTNFQPDLLDFFVPGEDFAFYESEDDCLKKINYYLSHETERAQIAANATGKMADAHTFVHRASTILAEVL